MARVEPSPSALDRLRASLANLTSPELQGTRAFTDIYLDSAMVDAGLADERAVAGRRRGRLDGRIVSIKALFDVAGTVTSAGSAVLRARKPAAEDATAVGCLRAAGAIILGKTQMTEFAFSAVGTNPHEPAPGNPYDRRRVPGGSSSGAVVSVVDGMAEIALGSDTGGSLRIPAALSGAVGFKPTGGRVPTAGAFSLSSTLDAVGPIALSVADCAAADAVMSGDFGAVELTSAPTASFQLIVPRGRLFERCEPEVIEAFERGVSELREHAVVVRDGSIEEALDEIAGIDALGTFPSIEIGATLRELGVTSLDQVDPNTAVRISAGAGVAGVDYVRMARLRAQAVLAFKQRLGRDEAFILPTTPIRAPLSADVEDSAAFHHINGLLLRNPRIANLLDCPSISLPLPVRGLPVGLMLIGRRGADRRLLEIAACVEAILRKVPKARRP